MGEASLTSPGSTPGGCRRDAGAVPSYIAFLRAVNVGGRAYPMAELRSAVEAAGLTGVATHIQSGNVLVESSARSTATVAAALERVFVSDRGFEVPTIVLTPTELRRVVADADELSDGSVTRQHVDLLRTAPDAEATALVEGLSRPGLRYVVRGRAVHLLLHDVRFGDLKPWPAAVRRATGDTTNRNVTVLRTLVEKWCSGDE